MMILALCAMFAHGALAQRVLTLDECRRMALQNNKSLAQSRAARDKAMYTRMAAETNYLPKVEAIAGYMHVGREISILNDDQKSALNNVGTNLVNGIMTPLQSPQAQAILAQNPDLLPLVQQLQGRLGTLGSALDGFGHDVTDAFRTDTRNLFGGAVLLTQPLYMGGKIRAYDNITHYSERLANLKLSADEQEIILEVDRAYWQVVSLSNKLSLAKQFRSTLQKLSDDVQKMIDEGVATRANELQVAVRLNEAEMLVTKVEDGLALSRMLLAQLTGADAQMQAAPADSVCRRGDVRHSRRYYACRWWARAGVCASPRAPATRNCSRHLSREGEDRACGIPSAGGIRWRVHGDESQRLQRIPKEVCRHVERRRDVQDARMVVARGTLQGAGGRGRGRHGHLSCRRGAREDRASSIAGVLARERSPQAPAPDEKEP